jgi:catechol 2,3-dioxygenase-like lactoylglutathione lyase family enzyme
MTIESMDHVNLMVEDLKAAIAWFEALGMMKVGEQPLSGEWLDRLNGLSGMKVDIALLQTPDGHGKIEMTQFHNPPLVDATPKVPPPNTPGLRQIMFAVDNLDATLARMLALGTEQIGETVQYENAYKLGYIRGPENIIVCLAEELS